MMWPKWPLVRLSAGVYRSFPGKLSLHARRRLRNQAKGWLNTVAVDQMTTIRLAERDPAGEVRQWLRTVASLVGQTA